MQFLQNNRPLLIMLGKHDPKYVPPSPELLARIGRKNPTPTNFEVAIANGESFESYLRRIQNKAKPATEVQEAVRPSARLLERIRRTPSTAPSTQRNNFKPHMPPQNARQSVVPQEREKGPEVIEAPQTKAYSEAINELKVNEDLKAPTTELAEQGIKKLHQWMVKNTKSIRNTHPLLLLSFFDSATLPPEDILYKTSQKTLEELESSACDVPSTLKK